MKKLSFYVLILLPFLGFLGCSENSSGPAGQNQTNQSLLQTCTPSSGARGTRVTCTGLTESEGCAILFDTQLVPRSVIGFLSATSASFSFPIPPSANGLYDVKKICGDQAVTLAQVAVVNRGGTAGMGGSAVPPTTAVCSAGSSSQCLIGQVCRGNQCVDACNTAYDCPSGQICENSQCVDNTRPTCGTGLPACSQGLVCFHGQCNPCLIGDASQCSRDNANYQGMVCRNATSTSSQIMGLCGACENTNQCGSGQACVSGRCGSCQRNDQCSAGSYCDAGRCMATNIGPNARANLTVSESRLSRGLLKIDWSLESIQASAVQEAYIYGPFGVESCNNILRTSENGVYRDGSLDDGIPCLESCSSGRCTCTSSSTQTVRSMSVGSGSSSTPVVDSGPRVTPGYQEDPVMNAPVLPRTSEFVAMTCRIPLRDALQNTVYARMRVSPSLFKLVVRSVDGQIFSSESRYALGSAGLQVDDVVIDRTNPFFTIQGSYTNAGEAPTFEGCEGGSYADNAATAGIGRVNFSQTCRFLGNGVLPSVQINIPGAIAGVEPTVKTVDFDCAYDEAATTFDFGDVYGPDGNVCARHDAISTPNGQILGSGTSCTSGQLELTTHIRQSCFINISGRHLSETPENIPWFVQFNVAQSSPNPACTASSGPIVVSSLTAAPGLSVTPTGEIRYVNRLTRDLTCNSYQMSISRGPNLFIELPIYIQNPGINIIKDFNTTAWAYDYILADTNCNEAPILGCTDFQYCTKAGGLEGEAGVWLHMDNYDEPQRFFNVPIGNPDGLSCSGLNGNKHDSRDGVAGCSKYNGHLMANIITRGAPSFTVSCCSYGEWAHGGNEAWPELDGPQGRYGQSGGGHCANGGRFFQWNSGQIPLLNGSTGDVSTSFDRMYGGGVLYGETFRCVVYAPEMTVMPPATNFNFFEFTRPIGSGHCDSVDRANRGENRDANDSDPSRLPLPGHAYPNVLPEGSVYPVGITTAP